MADSISQSGNSNLSKYFADIRKYRRLTKAEEQGLASGSQEELHKLVEANLPFVVKVASEYRNLGLPFEDLLNEGNLGLIEAATRYDAGKGTKFVTYAIWWVRKSILKSLTEHSNLVRVPPYQMSRVRDIRDTENSLTQKLRRRPRRDEIAADLQRKLTKVDQLLQYNLREMSLDAREYGKDRDRSLADVLIDDRVVDPESDCGRRELIDLVREVMLDLRRNEGRVLAYRFGIKFGNTDPRRPHSLKEIGDIMGISRERVRQIEGRAKARFREILALEVPSSKKPSGNQNEDSPMEHPLDYGLRPLEELNITSARGEEYVFGAASALYRSKIGTGRRLQFLVDQSRADMAQAIQEPVMVGGIPYSKIISQQAVPMGVILQAELNYLPPSFMNAAHFSLVHHSDFRSDYNKLVIARNLVHELDHAREVRAALGSLPALPT